MASKRDIKLTLLFLLGFIIAYAEGWVIEELNKIYDPKAWYPAQAIIWTAVFGIFHSMFLIKMFAGGRFADA